MATTLVLGSSPALNRWPSKPQHHCSFSRKSAAWQPRQPHRTHIVRCADSVPKPTQLDGEVVEGLTQEEDWVVPGGYTDSLSSNTQLGQAVDQACSELEHLRKLEMDSLTQASELLKKLGYKGDIMQESSPPSES